jgi:hypothetical protein
VSLLESLLYFLVAWELFRFLGVQIIETALFGTLCHLNEPINELYSILQYCIWNLLQSSEFVLMDVYVQSNRSLGRRSDPVHGCLYSFNVIMS